MQNGEGNITGIIEKEGIYYTEIKTCAFYNDGYQVQIIYMNPNSCLSYDIKQYKKHIIIITISSLILFIIWILNWIKHFSYHNIIHLILTLSFFLYVIEKILLAIEFNSINKSDDIPIVKIYRIYFQSIRRFLVLFSLKLICNGYGIYYDNFTFLLIIENSIVCFLFSYLCIKIKYKMICIIFMLLLLFESLIAVIVNLCIIESKNPHNFHFIQFHNICCYLAYFYLIFLIVDGIESHHWSYSSYSFHINFIDFLFLLIFGHQLKIDKNTLKNYFEKQYTIIIFPFKDIDKCDYERITHVKIPSRIKTIKRYAFSKCQYLSKIEFEKNSKLSSIGADAFAHTSIDNIVVPSSVQSIDRCAFADCLSLKRVDFEEISKIKVLKKYLFCDSAIETLSIPSSVIRFEAGWCISTPMLNNIILSSDNHFFSLIDKGLLIDNNTNYLLFAPRNIKNFVLPSFIRGISQFAFQNCRRIQKVEILNDSKLKVIDDSAFSSSSINYLSILSNVSVISDHAFEFCDNLYKIEFSYRSNVSFIGKYAFYKSSISKIFIPSKVKKIKEYTFYSCRNLKSVVFADESELSEIGMNAFEKSSIGSFCVPSNVNWIAKSAFCRCKRLMFFSFQENSKLESIHKDTFIQCNKEIRIFVPVDLRPIFEKITGS